MKDIDKESIDLILTDPPYDISRESNFTKVSSNAPDSIKTKYSKHSIDFGEWDSPIDLDFLFSEYYRILRKGGTLLIFYDIWKSSQIKKTASKFNFKQPRVGVWIKNNPVPVNSKINYLSNATEFFFTFVKDKKPTFNSEYDNATYQFPLCHGKERLEHPTQKPLIFIQKLIQKHSNENNLILDTFSGTGTLAEACIKTNRNFICIEKDPNYFDMSINRLKHLEGKII